MTTRCSNRSQPCTRASHGHARFAVPLFTLVLAALAIGCRVAPARVTGVDAGAHGVHASATCVRRCASEYHESRRAEHRRHGKAVRACRGDDECRRAEQIRHRRRLADLEEARRRCLHACYDEGAGRGGR